MTRFTCVSAFFSLFLLVGCGGSGGESPNLDDAQTKTEIQQHDADVDAAEAAQSKP